MEKIIDSLVERIENKINETPTGELRNLLCDINIVIQSDLLCKHEGEKRSDPLGGFFCVECGSFINKI